MPYPGVGSAAARRATACRCEHALRAGRNEPRLPVHLRLLRRAAPPGPQVPRARRGDARRRDRAQGSGSSASGTSTSGATPSRSTPRRFGPVLRRADCPQARRSGGSPTPAPTTWWIPEFVGKLRQSGCWMLSLGIESESDDVRRNMLKRLEREKIRLAFQNLRARRHQVVRLLHLRLSGRHARVDASGRRATPSSSTPTSPTSTPPSRILAPSCTRSAGATACSRRRLVEDGVLAITCCAETGSTRRW